MKRFLVHCAVRRSDIDIGVTMLYSVPLLSPEFLIKDPGIVSPSRSSWDALSNEHLPVPRLLLQTKYVHLSVWTDCKEKLHSSFIPYCP